MSNAAVDTGLQPYILNDYNGIPADGGEDSGDDDAQEDDDPYLDELLNDWKIYVMIALHIFNLISFKHNKSQCNVYYFNLTFCVLNLRTNLKGF